MEKRSNERSRGYTFRKGKNYRYNNQEVLISVAPNLLLSPSFCSDWLCLVNLGSSTCCASVRVSLNGQFLLHVPLIMEHVSRIDDLLTLNLFQCRDDFALEVLAGLLPQLIIYLVIISIWFAPSTASGVNIYSHKHIESAAT